ncbi:MAG: hypothetical protein EKK48_12500 [Candidatus Melainabacteria bacterium]|nr:MAG: hypothetical protein EKK48_12500 [Candidatus Melainabacteria bacterium]
MQDQDLVQMRADLVSQQEDIDFELFAVGQGVAPEVQTNLRLRSDAVRARIGTVDSMFESRARARANVVLPVSTMSKSQIDSEFEALMTSLRPSKSIDATGELYGE